MASKRNIEGYPDPTAYGALSNVEQEEERRDKRARRVVGSIKLICELAGFEHVGRIQLKDLATGKEYK